MASGGEILESMDSNVDDIFDKLPSGKEIIIECPVNIPLKWPILLEESKEE